MSESSTTPEPAKLSLYYYPECYFCARVVKEIQRLDMDVELRHIRKEPRYREELFEARGRMTVPVLRIDSADGTQWMAESRDIVRHLQSLSPNAAPQTGGWRRLFRGP